MGKTLLVVGLVLGIIFSPIIAAITLLVVIATPAVDQELSTIECFSAVPATGQWRPPFAQAYTQTSTFGMRFHPIHQVTTLHAGVDLTAKPAAGEVVAPSSGTVTNVFWSDSGGNIVEIDHGNQVKSRFLHLSRTTVSKGDAILAGEPLGIEGTTGNSTGIHLHFEIHVNGEVVDPGCLWPSGAHH
ncbi:M23 family metallopeptidase [Ornithinimicrobium sp. INDO-MA30-4]|uniref:M23 family metallopeptidase n=1 Tax=Ornithinimicrobium sp. INDO-MA30-4 TaxID=2908651 RepID=UPI001F33B4D0|nr:M23 family metallopeptidase [Ornithinimicrobium sp. INDO-MA30-4]UJH71748.1 M23 family metallopeptidase [Ornithinimicrobium sp. INDO-MA30-4]